MLPSHLNEKHPSTATNRLQKLYLKMGHEFNSKEKQELAIADKIGSMSSN